MALHTLFPPSARILLAILILAGLFFPRNVLAQGTPANGDVITPQAIDIVGGQPATPGEWPWQTGIVINTFFSCGGSLIHPRWIVTAAHCVGDDPSNFELPSSYLIVAGDHDRTALDGFEQLRNAIQIVVHPKWNPATSDNDIALLKLDVPVALNSRVGILPLAASPADDAIMEPGDLSTVTGWGDTAQGGDLAAILQEVQIPIVANATCDAAMGDVITENMICAGPVEGGADSCQGDSGGPLVVPDGNGGWKLAGIVSFGVGCALPNKYGVYTRVSQYVEWIQQYINSPTASIPVGNGNFDLGRNGDWQEFSQLAYDVIIDQDLPVTPRSGDHLAWLGGDNDETSSLEQVISLSERTAELTFYHQIHSTETECTNDIATVSINGVEQATFPLCAATATLEWTKATVDVSSFAGRTVLLTFEITTNGSLISSLILDDVAVTISPLPAFALTNFAPTVGGIGTVVTVDGSNFHDLAEVLFNGVSAPYTVQSDSVLTVTVPPQSSTGVITLKTTYSETTSATPFSVLQPLVIAKAGNGSGTVTSDPGGIACGEDCSDEYDESTSITLSAQPAAKSIFAGWSGDCEGNDTTCSVNMDAARNVTATFEVESFALNVETVGNGTITSEPVGINCGVDCTENYEVDTEVTLTAQPAPDSLFSGWTGACTGLATDCVLDIDTTQTATATFELKTVSLSVFKVGNGSISSSPAGITCGVTCSAAFDSATDVTLTATPEANFEFVGWSGDECTGDEVQCTVKVAAAKAITATFALKTFALHIDKVGNGSISSAQSGIACGVDCSEVYPIGTTVLLSAEPDPNSQFVEWRGACSGAQQLCNVTIEATKNVTAVFALKNFALTVTKVGNGNGTVTSEFGEISCGAECTQNYTIGTSVTLTAVAGIGSTFLGWLGACSGTQATCTVLISDTTNVSAEFAADTPQVRLPYIRP